MKKIILIFAFALASGHLFAQSVFDKFDDNEKITTVIVNQKMFKMMGDTAAKDKDAREFMALAKKLTGLKVYVTTDNKLSDDMKVTSDRYIKTAALEELMRINDKGQNIKIFVKSGAKDTQVKELMMFIEGSGKSQTVLLSLTGNFDLDELSALTDKMKLPGGEQLNKAGKGSKGSK